MRLVAVLLVCACLLGSTLPVEPDRSVEVWPEERCADGWVVHWTYGGMENASVHVTVEEARRLYAVLAGVMVGGDGR